MDWDTELAGVRIILLVENSVRFYSSYLPMLYREVMEQTQALMADGVNARQRLRRMKGASEDPSGRDVRAGLGALRETSGLHPRDHQRRALHAERGHADPQAGIEFVRRVKELDPDMPALHPVLRPRPARQDAQEIGAAFVDKHSPTLLEELRRFMRTSLGFGDFVFVLPDGTEVARVPDLAEMARALRTVPEESLLLPRLAEPLLQLVHGADGVRSWPRGCGRCGSRSSRSTEELRAYLIECFSQLRSDTRRGVVVEFSRADFDEAERLRDGSAADRWGARGADSASSTRCFSQVEKPGIAEGVRIFVPPVGRHRHRGLRPISPRERPAGIRPLRRAGRGDQRRRSCRRSFPDDHGRPAGAGGPDPLPAGGPLVEPARGLARPAVRRDLPHLHAAQQPRGPPRGACGTSAPRSSSSTPRPSLRNAKAYLRHTPYRSEEEKMAVVIQKLVGRAHGAHFYPDFAGVARSYNYYPVMDLKAEDGIAVVALGFGKTVVEGGRSIRFSPGRAGECCRSSRARRRSCENAQSGVLCLEPGAIRAIRRWPSGGRAREARPGCRGGGRDARRRGLRLVAGQRRRLRRDLPARDPAGHLRPDAEERLLSASRDLCAASARRQRAMSCPVEIEFAVNLRARTGGRRSSPSCRSGRWWSGRRRTSTRRCREPTASQILCLSPQALGHGRIRDIRDVVYVRPDAFDRARRRHRGRGRRDQRAADPGERPYLLIGPGRWGTSDPLARNSGRVAADHGARAIVETDLETCR